MKTLFATLLFVSFAHAAPTNQTYVIRPQKIKWGPRNPVSLCNELVMKPKFEITGEGSDLRLNFTFQGQKYSIPNGTSDPNKLVFQQSTNTGDTESAVILVEGQIENDQYNGIAQFKIKKNVSIVTAKDSKKWSPHRYDCDVTYNFQGKPTTIK